MAPRKKKENAVTIPKPRTTMVARTRDFFVGDVVSLCSVLPTTNGEVSDCILSLFRFFWRMDLSDWDVSTDL